MDTQPKPTIQARSEETKQRLLDAAVKLFGTYGFDAVTTRRLTQEAKVNQVAIPYHFGGKEGLYIAVAEYIVDRIRRQVAPALVELVDAETARMDPVGAKRVLKEVLGRLAGLLVGTSEAQHWARFILREQMDPSPAFDVLYEGVFDTIVQSVLRLCAIATGGKESDPDLKLRVITIIGQIVVFRAARSAVLRTMDWSDVGAPEVQTINRIIGANVDAMLSEPAS